jgi:hypothetical protein
MRPLHRCLLYKIFWAIKFIFILRCFWSWARRLKKVCYPSPRWSIAVFLLWGSTEDIASRIPYSVGGNCCQGDEHFTGGPYTEVILTRTLFSGSIGDKKLLHRNENQAELMCQLAPGISGYLLVLYWSKIYCSIENFKSERFTICLKFEWVQISSIEFTLQSVVDLCFGGQLVFWCATIARSCIVWTLQSLVVVASLFLVMSVSKMKKKFEDESLSLQEKLDNVYFF